VPYKITIKRAREAIGECIPDAALVFMAEVIGVAIVTFIEVAGMATVAMAAVEAFTDLGRNGR
jgi:hypothetical protein